MRGLTGVVITTKYGITKIVQPIQIGYTHDSKSPELSLQPGEVVYTLHYQGEAYDLFWYKGKTYSDQISLPDNAWGTPPNSQALQIITRPEYEWWAIIQDKNGNIGWTKELTHLLMLMNVNSYCFSSNVVGYRDRFMVNAPIHTIF